MKHGHYTHHCAHRPDTRERHQGGSCTSEATAGSPQLARGPAVTEPASAPPRAHHHGACSSRVDAAGHQRQKVPKIGACAARRRASRARSHDDNPAHPQPASIRGRRRQLPVSTWQRERRLSGFANSDMRRHAGLKSSIRLRERGRRAVCGAGRRAPHRARARARA